MKKSTKHKMDNLEDILVIFCTKITTILLSLQLEIEELKVCLRQLSLQVNALCESNGLSNL